MSFPKEVLKVPLMRKDRPILGLTSEVLTVASTIRTTLRLLSDFILDVAVSRARSSLVSGVTEYCIGNFENVQFSDSSHSGGRSSSSSSSAPRPSHIPVGASVPTHIPEHNPDPLGVSEDIFPLSENNNNNNQIVPIRGNGTNGRTYESGYKASSQPPSVGAFVLC